MSLYSQLLRPALFALDAERAHNLTLAALGSPLGRALAPLTGGPITEPRLLLQCWNLQFANPLGLAAGLDKQGRAAAVWPALGFGFAEIGTVTPMPQPGNPRPRLFRLPADHAIINRFGFNSEGASAVAARLAGRRNPAARVGINVGRNKQTANEGAADDYIRAIEQLHQRADYFVVNVSSPNTEGLRALQQARELRTLMEQVVAAVRRCAPQRSIPVLVKVSPDEDPGALLESVSAALEGGAAGVVATNTTVGRDGLATQGALRNENGGLSGVPLRQPATAVCGQLYRHFGARVPIVGVGGISGPDDAYERIRAGASLIQIYTALVYEGPGVIGRILRGLSERLRRDGFHNVSEAIGVDTRQSRS